MTQLSQKPKGIFKRLTQGVAATAFSLAVKANNVDPEKDRNRDYTENTHHAAQVFEAEATSSQSEAGQFEQDNREGTVESRPHPDPLTDHLNHPRGMEGGWGKRY